MGDRCVLVVIQVCVGCVPDVCQVGVSDDVNRSHVDLRCERSREARAGVSGGVNPGGPAVWPYEGRKA